MRFICATIAIVLCVAFQVKCQNLSSMLGNVGQNAENLTVLQKWQTMEKSLKKVSGALVELALPHILKASETMNISSQCMQEGMTLLLGLKDIKPWAFRFIDSSAKVVDGLLVGSLSSLGVYDECINIEVKEDKGKDNGQVLFRGKYCTIDIKPPLPPMSEFYRLDKIIPELESLTQSGTVMADAVKYATAFYSYPIKMGVCVPSGCRMEDIDQVVNKLGDYLMLETKTYRCEEKEEVHLIETNICAVFVCCFLGFLTIIGSLIDMYSYYTGVVFKCTAVRTFLSFSFISNFKKFVNTDTRLETLSCLHGLRFMSMTWVILGHTYYFVNIQAIQNVEKVLQWGGTFAFQVILNGTVSVDSFFCMGGFLVCYWTIKIVKVDRKPFKILMYIVHRLWRILPAYIAVILIFLNYNFLLSGPLTHYFVSTIVGNCYKNWWRNLLFINNFYGFDEQCMWHTWYIAVDFQLYISALLILLPMIRWPRVGILLSILAITASILFTGVQTYVKDLTPTMLFVQFYQEFLIKYCKDLYFTPFAHAAPYCIGLLAGFLIATKPNFKMSPTIQLIGWIVAFACCYSTVYGVYNWNSGNEINFVAGLLYASFHRTAWAAGIAWVIVCCATGHGGVINYILSWKMFIPLGRLTFIAYLIHPFVQVGFMGSLRHSFEPDHFFIVWIFIGDLFVSYALAFAGYMLVEAPTTSLEKFIFRKRSTKAEEHASVRKRSILKGVLKTD